MTWFDLARDIFAIIGLIGVVSCIGGLIFILVYGVDELEPDEHADVKKGYPC